MHYFIQKAKSREHMDKTEREYERISEFLYKLEPSVGIHLLNRSRVLLTGTRLSIIPLQTFPKHCHSLLKFT